IKRLIEDRVLDRILDRVFYPFASRPADRSSCDIALPVGVCRRLARHQDGQTQQRPPQIRQHFTSRQCSMHNALAGEALTACRQPVAAGCGSRLTDPTNGRSQVARSLSLLAEPVDKGTSMASSRPQLNGRQTGEALNLLKYAQGIELKVTVPDADRHSAVT